MIIGLLHSASVDRLRVRDGEGLPGYHVMLFNLQQQAKDGERFPLTLTFEKAGTVEVQIAVHKDAPEATEPAKEPQQH